MTVNTELNQHERSDPTESPAIHVKTGFQRPLSKQLYQVLSLCSGQA